MFSKFKQEAMRQGMKMLSSPKVMKFMADPRFMNAITKGMEFKGRLDSEIDGKLSTLAATLNLATKKEVESLQRTLRKVERRCRELESKSTVDDSSSSS